MQLIEKQIKPVVNKTLINAARVVAGGGSLGIYYALANEIIDFDLLDGRNI